MSGKLKRWLRTGVMLALLSVACPVHAFYNPSAGRWLTRDPLGERGGANLYGFVGNDSLGIVDWFGLCGCTCKEVTITYNPGDRDFKWGFYKTAAGENKFGNKIHVKWTVDGDTKGCKYTQYEKGYINSREWNNTKGDWDESLKNGTEKDEPVPQEYSDQLGMITPFANIYEVVLKVEITFKCTSSDKTVVSKAVRLKGKARGQINSDGTTKIKVIE